VKQFNTVVTGQFNTVLTGQFNTVVTGQFNTVVTGQFNAGQFAVIHRAFNRGYTVQIHGLHTVHLNSLQIILKNTYIENLCGLD